ncbi:MAG: hypothetical protein ACRDRG_01590 [Pseudonocardiaceae bacterium]
MSGPHCFHLLRADGGLADQHRYGKYVALCGEVLAAWELPSALCPEDCDRAVTYCLGCIRRAASANEDASVDFSTVHPGWIVRSQR